MAAVGPSFSQYHDSLGDRPVSENLRGDVPQDPEARRKLRLLNNGIEQNQTHQRYLFNVIVCVVIGSLISIVLVNCSAAIGGTHLDSAVLISFNASIAVQAFLLLSVLARSLFPASGKKDSESTETT